MGTLLLGVSFALVHILFPDHWLPFVVVGKAQDWRPIRTAMVALTGGFFHSLVTVIPGIALSFFGGKIPDAGYLPGLIPAAIIIILGLRYIYLHAVHRRGHDRGEPPGHCPIHRVSDNTATFSLILMVSASPCVAFLPIFLSPEIIRSETAILLGLTYTAVTISGMTAFTYFAHAGLLRVNLDFLEKREYLIIGGFLIAIGIFIIVH